MPSKGVFLRLLRDFMTIVQKTAQSVEKFPLFNSKGTTAKHHRVEHASLNTHLHSFDSPIVVQEERPPLKPRTWGTGDRPGLARPSS